MRVGILALQGGVAPHEEALRRLGHVPIEIRSVADATNVAGLVLPGGESTTIRSLMEPNLRDALHGLVSDGAPVLATCAGLILCSQASVSEPSVRAEFPWLDIAVERNAWGRQVSSFTAISDRGHPLVFIRAPRIRATRADVIDTLEGEPILVRQDQVWGATFHPELANDPWLIREVFGEAP